MAIREIIRIDEEKCDGCGACVPSCAEGALQIVDGKARLVSDVYCDGLGACLGHCPRGAISIEKREAEAFDVELAPGPAVDPATGCTVEACPVACVGASGNGHAEAAPAGAVFTSAPFPYQLGLVPPAAPWLRGADVVVAADCTAYAHPHFSQLRGSRPLLIACPKLDDAGAHLEKLTDIMSEAAPASVTVLRMEVPCCSRLARLVEQAIDTSGREIPLSVVTITIGGEIEQAAAGKACPNP